MTATSSQRSLRDHLLASLSALSNPERLDLTVLTSIPKRTSALFPYAAHSPKCFEKEYLITVASEVQYASPNASASAQNGSASGSNGEPETASPQVGVDESATTIPPDVSIHQAAEAGSISLAENTTPAAGSSSTPRRVLVVALQAYLYTIPSTSTSVLYISKVDTSGYSPSPLPLTRQLLVSFLGFHLDPSTRPSRNVQVALFARSQSQYLFPNSAQAKGKRVSGGLRLCGWWKGVYEEVATGLLKQATTAGEDANANGSLALRYTLPSYSFAEAAGMLGAPRRPLSPGLAWTYAPPFGRNLFEPSSAATSTLPPAETSQPINLAWCIPSLPDDPKTRFLDEIVNDAPLPSAQRSEGHASRPKTLKEREKQRSEQERKASEATLRKMSTAEYWERMGFRQECSSGDVTGFFHLESVIPVTHGLPDTRPQTLSKSDPTADTAADTDADRPTTEGGSASKAEKANASPSCEIKAQIVERIHQALLNTDFKTIDYAVEGSEIWQRSVEGLVTDEIGQAGYERCRGVVDAKRDVERVVGPDRAEVGRVTTLQPRKRKTDGVNTLQPRRKEPKVAEINVLQPRRT